MMGNNQSLELSTNIRLETTSGAIAIRPAQRHDIPALMTLIHLKAEFDGCPQAVEATVERLEQTLFSDTPLAFVLLAEREGRAVGFATYHSIYSTFLARAGLWLDDLYICDAFRGQRIGKILIQELCRIAHDLNGGRIDWAVATTNDRAIGFYEHMGATVKHDVRLCRLDRVAIAHHAKARA